MSYTGRLGRQGTNHSLRLVWMTIVLTLMSLVLLQTTIVATAAPGDIEWVRQFGSTMLAGDGASAVDADGNIYMGGQVGGVLEGQVSVGGTDAFVRKYDSDGNEIWTRQFGTTGSDAVYGVAVDASGVYVVGYTNGTFPGQSSAGNYDAFVRKYDSDGNEIWTRQFGTSSYDISQAVTSDPSGVYVVGYVLGALPGQTHYGHYDAFVRKYDSDGNEIWTRQFGTTDLDTGRAVAVNPSGVYVVGQTWGALPGQAYSGNYDAFVRKYDSDGNEIWTRQFGTSSADHAFSLAVDVSGAYVVGQTSGTLPGQASSGGADAFVRKYDSDGNEIWTRQFGSSSHDEGYAVTVHTSGILVAGTAYGALPEQTSSGSADAFVRKYDSDGNEIWTRQFGTSTYDYARGVAADASGLYVTGSTSGTFPGQSSAGDAGLHDAFVRKYDNEGDEAWTRQFGSLVPMWDEAQALDVDGNIYVVGYVGGALEGEVSAGSTDAFMRKYDSDGNEIWTRQFGATGSDYGYGVAVNASGVYIVGQTSGTLPGQVSSGSYDAFMRKYDSDGNEIWTRQFGTTGSDAVYGVAVDASGVYVTGNTGGALSQTSFGAADVFLRKYDDDGNEIWTRQFGSSNPDAGRAVAVNANGVYVAGYAGGTLPGQASSGTYDAFARKYDSDGNEIWTRQFGTSTYDYAYGLAVDDSGVYLAGFTWGTLPGQPYIGGYGYDAFARKYNSDGNEIWTRQFGTSAYDYAYGVAVDDSGVYVTGNTNGTLPEQTSAGGVDAYMRVYDATGTELWTRQFGTSGEDSAFGIALDSTAIYVGGRTSGTFEGQTSSGNRDSFLLKLEKLSDTTPPIITPDVRGTLGDNGWYVDDVTVKWNYVDDESAVISTDGCETTVITADTAGTSLTCSATSAGGTSEATVEIKRDATPPTASAAVSPEANGNGWHNSDVTVGFNGTDNLSGIAFCSVDVIVTTEGANQSASGTCTDLAGNVSAPAMADNINIDKTAPTASATVSPASNTHGWHNSDVTVTFNGTDALSGIDFCDATTTITDEGAAQSASGTCTDMAGNVSDVATASGINIDKTAPILTITTPQLYDVQPLGTELDFSASDDMSGLDGPAAAMVTQADASTTEQSGFAPATGVYTVVVTAKDLAGNTTTSAEHILVIYDPEGGFVTGGGWIISPEGACLRCPESPEGKATFGFVSKYKKGASEPTGNTEFQFKAGGLNFHSSSYEWLVIAGANAKYKGEGTINGEGTYKFMLTATDGDLLGGGKADEFRIRIWDDNGLYYDNKSELAEDEYGGTELGGGSIKIHKAK